MARKTVGPWFRTSADAWFAEVDGRSVSLRVRGRGNEPEARRAWHLLMAGEAVQTAHKPLKAKCSSENPPTATVSVQSVLHGFLADAPNRMSAACLRNYRCFLEPFGGKFSKRSAETLTPQEAEGYARKPEWSSTYRANFLTAVGAVYRWALRERLIGSNPMTCLRKPARESRGTQAVITADDFGKLVRHAKPDTRDLVVLGFVAAHTERSRGENPNVTAEQVCRGLDRRCRATFRRRRGVAEGVHVGDVIRYHQRRNAAAAKARKKKRHRSVI